jgi:hypothetical protein
MKKSNRKKKEKIPAFTGWLCVPRFRKIPCRRK